MDTIVSLLYGVSVTAIAVATPFVLNHFADDDILFTKVEEGTAKAIMRGKTLASIVMSNGSTYLNDPRMPWFIDSIPEWEVLPQDKWKAEIAASPYVGNCESRGLLAKSMGLYPVGLPPFMAVHKYDFEWSEGGTGNAPLRNRNEETDFIYVVEFPYTVTLQGAENKDGIPIDVRFQLSLQIVNPAKALFTENWLDVAIAAALRSARSYVGSKTFDQLKSENNPEDVGTGDLFSLPIKDLSNLLPDDESPVGKTDKRKAELKKTNGLSGRIGAIVISANIQTLEISGEVGDEVRRATTALYTAEQVASAAAAKAKGEAKATLITAEAKAQSIRIIGEAEAAAITARLNAYSATEKGMLLAQFDAMSKETQGKVYVWANNPLVADVPLLSKLSSELGLTPEQITGLLKTFMNRSPE